MTVLARLLLSWTFITYNKRLQIHSIRGQYSYLGCGFNPWSRSLWEATYPRTTSASLSPTPSIYGKCKFLQNNLHLSSPNCNHKNSLATPGQRPFNSPTQPCCCRVSLHAPAPGPFLTGIWFYKLFFSEKLLIIKGGFGLFV